MAKKKGAHQPKQHQENLHQQQQHLDQTNNNTNTTTTTTIPTMDDQSEKVQSLKSLNSLLLKETHERRLQVESLTQMKEALESELNRSVMEKKGLNAEVNRMSDEAVGLELEKCLMGICLQTQMGEIGVEVGNLVRKRVEVEKKMEGLKREFGKWKSERENEIMVLKKEVSELKGDVEKEREVSSRVARERDGLKGELDVQIREANVLRKKVVEMEKKERKMVDQAQKLKMSYDGIVNEGRERESTMKSLLVEKDLVEVESRRVSEDLRREIGEIAKAKNEIEEERNVQLRKIKKLEKEVSVLNGIVLALRVDEGRLRSEVLEMEKSNAELVEKQERTSVELNVLHEQKKKNENSIEILLEEKTLTTRSLEECKKELEGLKRLNEVIVLEKNEVEEVKAKRESEIVVLQKDLGKLRTAMLTLQEKTKAQEVENKRLESEVRRYRDAIDRVTIERDDLKQQNDVIGLEKSEAEEVKARRESEIVKLQKDFGEVRNLMVKLQEMTKAQEEEKKHLESEVSRYRDAVDRVTIERDDLQKGLEEVKKNEMQLRSKISEMEKKVKESLKEKEGLGGRLEMLMGENELLQKSLSEYKEKLGDVQGRLESKCDHVKSVLTMLKNTAALVYKTTDETNGNDVLLANRQKLEDEKEVQPYLVELEASIKDAFKSKETKVEEMKRQLAFLQNSVVEANKQKGIWTLISSATTLLVAASVAYVARGR